MFENALVVEQLHVPQGPYPLRAPIPVNIECRFRLPKLSRAATLQTEAEFTAWLDDQRPSTEPLREDVDLDGAKKFARTVVEGVSLGRRPPMRPSRELKVLDARQQHLA